MQENYNINAEKRVSKETKSPVSKNIFGSELSKLKIIYLNMNLMMNLFKLIVNISNFFYTLDLKIVNYPRYEIHNGCKNRIEKNFIEK